MCQRGAGVITEHPVDPHGRQLAQLVAIIDGVHPHFEPTGGETLVQLRERIAATTHRLAAQHTEQLIVLVAHGGVLDMLYRLATGLDLQAPRTWLVTNASINRLLWTPQGLTLVGWADTQHLDTGSRDETVT